MQRDRTEVVGLTEGKRERSELEGNAEERERKGIKRGEGFLFLGSQSLQRNVLILSRLQGRVKTDAVLCLMDAGCAFVFFFFFSVLAKATISR